MAVKKELIQFTIENDTNCSYNIPLFQQNVYSINATTKYSWNVTTADLSCGTGSIVINGITYNITYSPNLSGLLQSLNALGFGFFCFEIISGQTYIYTTDDVNIYGNLSLCSTGTTTTTTSTSTTAAPTTTTTTSTSTTTSAPTTTTTTSTSTTTAAPTTTTSTSTTTAAPTTTTTTSTSTTTEAPTTTTTTSTTTTEAPTTTTTTSTTTTETPTTTTTTSTSTTETSTTTTTTTSTTTLSVSCTEYTITGTPSISIEWFDCGGAYLTQTVFSSPLVICAETGSVNQTGGSGSIVAGASCP